ncbi:hypothetical protein ACLB2K_042106 [Fragaria x ananassa]
MSVSLRGPEKLRGIKESISRLVIVRFQHEQLTENSSMEEKITDESEVETGSYLILIHLQKHEEECRIRSCKYDFPPPSSQVEDFIHQMEQKVLAVGHVMVLRMSSGMICKCMIGFQSRHYMKVHASCWWNKYVRDRIGRVGSCRRRRWLLTSAPVRIDIAVASQLMDS